MKTLRKIIEIDEKQCDGCGQCVPSCAEGALAIIDGKAKVISDNLCDGLGACLGECPTGALRIIEREADEFCLEKSQKPEAFISMMTKLGEMNLAEFSPSRFIEIFFYDHPPIGKRIAFA